MVWNPIRSIFTKTYTKPDDMTNAVDIWYKDGDLRVDHIDGFEAGMNDVEFESRAAFGDALRRNELDPDGAYTVEAPDGRILSLWTCREVMLLMDSNPMEESGPHVAGIEGREDAVEDLYEDLLDVTDGFCYASPDERRWL